MRGRFPRFAASDLIVMAILRDSGWSYDRIADSFGTARSVVRRYVQGYTRRLMEDVWA